MHWRCPGNKCLQTKDIIGAVIVLSSNTCTRSTKETAYLATTAFAVPLTKASLFMIKPTSPTASILRSAL